MELEFEVVSILSDCKAAQPCAPAEDLIGTEGEAGPQVLGGWCVCGYGNGPVNKDQQFQDSSKDQFQVFIAVQLSLALSKLPVAVIFSFYLSFSPASSGFPEDKLGQNYVRNGIHGLLSKPVCSL